MNNKKAYKPLVLTQKSYDYTEHEPQLQSSMNYVGAYTGFGTKIEWTNPKDFEKRATRLYYHCSISRRCIDIRAERVASVPIVLEGGNADSKALIESPNVIDGTLRQSLRVWETNLALGGDLWMFLDRRIKGAPQLHTFRQDYMVHDATAATVTYDPGILKNQPRPEYKFDFKNGRSTQAYVAKNGKWEKIDGALIHIMEHNPLSSGQGSGAGDAVLREVDTWVAANTLIASRFQAGGRKNGFVSAPQLHSDEEVAQWKAALQQLSQAAIGDTGVLAGGATFTSNQLTFTELDVVNILDAAARTIANGFAVPAVMLNLAGESSYARDRSVDRIYYTSWVKPRAQWITEQLESHLKRVLDPTIKLAIDDTQLPYFQDDLMEQAKAQAAIGCFTVNEIRKILSYEPVDGGDELMKPVSAPKPEPTAPETPDQGTQEAPNNPREVDFNADTSRRPSEKRAAK